MFIARRGYRVLLAASPSAFTVPLCSEFSAPYVATAIAGRDKKLLLHFCNFLLNCEKMRQPDGPFTSRIKVEMRDNRIIAEL